MASKFLSQDEKDQVGIINRQLTLSEATPVSGEGAATAAPTSPAGATVSAGAAAPATSQPAASTSGSNESSGDEAATSGSAASATQAAAIPVDADAPAAEPEASSLLDGLKVIAKNGHAEGDAGREERLSVGQAPVIFDTADSPACTECGSIMVRNGSCYKCINCGATSGCS
jgi:ribonucleoside-diphosphate reductase alpha chain